MIGRKCYVNISKLIISKKCYCLYEKIGSFYVFDTFVSFIVNKFKECTKIDKTSKQKQKYKEFTQFLRNTAELLFQLLHFIQFDQDPYDADNFHLGNN